MPSENTILNLFRRLFSFFNNSTSHYRLRTWRQKAARFRLPKHIMVEHSQPDGVVSCYEYDRYDPLAQVCNWTSMPTVRRGCITTSSGIMSLMQVGLLIRIWLGWLVEDSMNGSPFQWRINWKEQKLNVVPSWGLRILLKSLLVVVKNLLGDVEEYRLIPYYVKI